MTALETLHIMSAVLWLGNFVVTGIWALRSAREAPEIRAFATREILFTDVLFTFVFGSAVVISGIMLARAEGLAILQVRWTATALAIVGAAAVVWAVVLLPVEVRLHRAARERSASYDRLFLVWNVVGWMLTLALLSVIYLMVAKPA